MQSRIASVTTLNLIKGSLEPAHLSASLVKPLSTASWIIDIIETRSKKSAVIIFAIFGT